MTIEEKKVKLQELFNQQKEILVTLTISNFMDCFSKIHQLELQKEIIKAIPLPRYNEGVIQYKDSEFILVKQNEKEGVQYFCVDNLGVKTKINPPIDFVKHTIGHFDINLKKV